MFARRSSIRASLPAAILGGTVLLALASACDSKATASDPVAASPLRQSREGESCAATSSCADGLRCLEQVCEREARSMVGDFLAARGARALAGGDVAGALKAYNEASAAYESEKLTVPPDLDCAWGQALVAARAQKDKAELAARILHRCLLASPAGGKLRAGALAALTELDRSGFDPRQLARPQLADLYLTGAPSKPDTGSLTVSVTPEPSPRGKGWTVIAARLAQPDVKQALVGCWDQAYEQRQERELTAKLTLTVKYFPSDYEDEPGKTTYAVEPAAGGGAAADVAACARAAVLAPLADLKGVRDTFTTSLHVSVK